MMSNSGLSKYLSFSPEFFDIYRNPLTGTFWRKTSLLCRVFPWNWFTYHCPKSLPVTTSSKLRFLEQISLVSGNPFIHWEHGDYRKRLNLSLKFFYIVNFWKKWKWANGKIQMGKSNIFVLLWAVALNFQCESCITLNIMILV